MGGQPWDVVMFGRDRLDGPWPRTPERVATALALTRRVLFVEPPLSPATLLLRPGRWPDRPRGLRPVAPQLWAARPWELVPDRLRPAAAAANARWAAAQVRRWMARLDLVRPVLWAFRPGDLRYLGRLGERLAVYHLSDEPGSFPGLPAAARARLGAADRDFCRRADLVLATAPALAEDRRGLNPRLCWVPAGVDLGPFAGASSAPADPQVAALPPPVAGYVGVISEYKVDLGLLAAVVAACPDWSFALAGPLEVDPARLPRGPRVRWLGPRPPAAVAQVLAGCQVALIPHRTNANTRCSFPLKLYEYLAAGLPVVSTPFADLGPDGRLVRFAPDAAAFAAAMAAAWAEDGPGPRAERRATARAAAWESRAAEMVRAVDEVLAGR